MYPLDTPISPQYMCIYVYIHIYELLNKTYPYSATYIHLHHSYIAPLLPSLRGRNPKPYTLNASACTIRDFPNCACSAAAGAWRDGPEPCIKREGKRENTYTDIYIYICDEYMCIYIYIERERGVLRDIQAYLEICIWDLAFRLVGCES